MAFPPVDRALAAYMAKLEDGLEDIYIYIYMYIVSEPGFFLRDTILLKFCLSL